MNDILYSKLRLEVPSESIDEVAVVTSSKGINKALTLDESNIDIIVPGMDGYRVQIGVVDKTIPLGYGQIKKVKCNLTHPIVPLPKNYSFHGGLCTYNNELYALACKETTLDKFDYGETAYYDYYRILKLTEEGWKEIGVRYSANSTSYGGSASSGKTQYYMCCGIANGIIRIVWRDVYVTSYGQYYNYVNRIISYNIETKSTSVNSSPCNNSSSYNFAFLLNNDLYTDPYDSIYSRYELYCNGSRLMSTSPIEALPFTVESLTHNIAYVNFSATGFKEFTGSTSSMTQHNVTLTDTSHPFVFNSKLYVIWPVLSGSTYRYHTIAEIDLENNIRNIIRNVVLSYDRNNTYTNIDSMISTGTQIGKQYVVFNEYKNLIYIFNEDLSCRTINLYSSV